MSCLCGIKYAEHSYKSVERNSNPSKLIYIDICDMKSTPSLDEEKYFITFIDNFIRNDYVYLLDGKDETIKMSRQYNVEVKNQLEKR